MDIQALRALQDPVLGTPFAARLHQGREPNALTLVTPYIAHPEYGSHFNAVNITLRKQLSRNVALTCDYRPPTLSQQTTTNAKVVKGVKNILAVGAGKGGVGKSTVATLIALASQLLGMRVGVLDADIYGANQLRLLGAAEHTRLQVTANNRFTPLQLKGLSVVSFAGVSGESTPVVWRGPMISSALQQLLLHTDWPELDLLVVDLPPGTGDIQLTLAASVQLAALVLVTTPQALALSEVAKTIAMAEKLHIPIAGFVENMGHFICDTCQTKHHPFGQHKSTGLLSKISQLGSLPITAELQKANGEIDFTPASHTGTEALQIAEAISLVLAKISLQHNAKEDNNKNQNSKQNNIIARELV